MTSPQENQQQEQKPNDKELNFRALEAKYQKQLDQQRQETERLQRELQEKSKAALHEEDNDDEPYVDHKKLEKKLNKFGQSQQSEIQKAMEIAKQSAKEELKQEMWLEKNPDFYDTLKHAEKFAIDDPELANIILEVPEGFNRQKLVYKHIKKFGYDKPQPKQPSIQEKIDANRRSPYYQPSGVGSAPYSQGGDFSESGQKNAYEQMKKLQKQLRI
jgi:hypothetical protein